jgi:hypothetical protein
LAVVALVAALAPRPACAQEPAAAAPKAAAPGTSAGPPVAGAPAGTAGTGSEGSPEIHVSRAAGPIVIDGDLTDAGWQGATRVETFFETAPGDNTPAAVRTVAHLAYDDRYFYAAFEFFDPDPGSIRAPFGDRDEVPGYTDYGGILLDTKHDGKTGVLLVANPRNVQYDSINNDVTGNEDPSYDIYWDSAARIEKWGWALEMRVPFSSLRYTSADPQTWGILLYRNRPRNFRVQMFSAKLPRGSNCFVCHANPLTGLAGLPKGGHLVAAPYLTGTGQQLPRSGAGSRLGGLGSRATGGLDAKWTPNANNAVDLTINPDFSQVESDVAQIATNQRFALFFPEKRPFFLEGLELFATPIQAVYTRTITAPRWGGRATGELGSTSYTMLVTEDKGGGSFVLPGPQASTLVNQDFGSRVAIGRARYDVGRSFGSFLLTDREDAGGGHNRVAGPDFQWRMTGDDTLTGQLLLSDTQDPNRPDLDPSLTGGSRRSHAFDVRYERSTRTWDGNVEARELGGGFRVDDGFEPQVGFRQVRGGVGYNFYPTGSPLWHHVHVFLGERYTTDTRGALLMSRTQPAVSFNGFWNGYYELDWNGDRVRVGNRVIGGEQIAFFANMTPSRLLSLVAVNGFVGKQPDYDNARPGRGGLVNVQVTLRPTAHLTLDSIGAYDWLDVTAGPRGGGRLGPGGGRLFTATVGRVRASYTFTARSFLRLIGQQVRTERHPELYLAPISRRDEARTLSALFGYRLNWQTVLYVGYGDESAIAAGVGGGAGGGGGDPLRLAAASRTVFFKVSYAYQR